MDRLSNYKTLWDTCNDTGGVSYVHTRIVEWDAHSVTLRTGGWRTVTTKRKMNQAARQFGLGYGVHQRKGRWYVSRWDNAAKQWIDEQPFDSDTFVFIRSHAAVAA
jgi:hypothetical protein